VLEIISSSRRAAEREQCWRAIFGYPPDRPYPDIRRTSHRVRAGLQRAKANGVRLGRKPTSPKVEERIRELRATGIGIIKIARQLGIGVSVVQRVVAT
jgi:hypothetical protein